MLATFRLDQKQMGAVEATVTMTMTVEAWHALYRVLKKGEQEWPTLDVLSSLCGLLSKVEEEIYTCEEE